MVKLRKPSVQELLREYQKLQIKSEVYEENYEKATKDGDTKARLQATKDMIYNSISKYEYMLQVIDKFSHTVAKGLSKLLKNYKRRMEDQLGKDYFSLPELRNMSEKSINEIINNTIDISVDFLKIHGKHITDIFIAISDTIKRTTGKTVEEKDESLKKLLQEIDPKYADIYEGAWKALESDNPERIRHSSSSLRELIQQVINLGTGQNRKEKLISILKSEKETELVNSLTDSVIALSNVLNKGVHEDLEFDTALFVMKITEHILHYILDKLTKNYKSVNKCRLS